MVDESYLWVVEPLYFAIMSCVQNVLQLDYKRIPVMWTTV